VKPSSSGVNLGRELYCCWLLSFKSMPRITIFLLCLPQVFKAMQSTVTSGWDDVKNLVGTTLSARLWESDCDANNCSCIYKLLQLLQTTAHSDFTKLLRCPLVSDKKTAYNTPVQRLR